MLYHSGIYVHDAWNRSVGVEETWGTFIGVHATCVNECTKRFVRYFHGMCLIKATCDNSTMGFLSWDIDFFVNLKDIYFHLIHNRSASGCHWLKTCEGGIQDNWEMQCCLQWTNVVEDVQQYCSIWCLMFNGVRERCGCDILKHNINIRIRTRPGNWRDIRCYAEKHSAQLLAVSPSRTSTCNSHYYHNCYLNSGAIRRP